MAINKKANAYQGNIAISMINAANEHRNTGMPIKTAAITHKLSAI
ncbi:hypothetical protein [Nocardia sp. NPDC005366]